MLQLGAQDSQFLYMESGHNLSNVTMVCIYAKPENPAAETVFELVKSHVESRLHTNPIFRRKLVRVPLDLDYPYWVDDEYFDFESHLHLHRLASPGDWGQFCDLVGRIHSRPLDMNRPVWEIHVVENLSGIADIPPDSFAMVTKIHHSAVDGASTIKFFSGLSDLDAEGTPVTDLSLTAESAGEPPTTNEMWARCVLNHIRSPIKLAETLWRATPTLVPAAINAVFKVRDDDESTRVPKTRFNKPVSPRKTFHGVEFELADFKRIATAVDDAKINDVVLAVSSGALRKYLLRHHGLPSESLIAWVPVNTRPAKGAKGGEDGNQITAMTVDLHTDLASPLQRLKEITRYTQLTKAGKTGVSARLMTDVSKHMPGATMALASRMIMASGVTASLCNVAISNVPGPQFPIYLNGAKCLKQYGMTPLGDGMGLFLMTLSYNKKLTFSITTTEDVMPDVDLFGECLAAAVTELKNATDKAKTKPVRKTVAKGRK